MSKIDDKYIDALQDFTAALEEVVKTLKEQQKDSKSDVVNEMLKNMPNNLETIVNDLKKVRKDTHNIKNNTETILKEVKAARKAKETGMFDRVEDPKNKNKIVDGIKVVVLIAAGVLALGMAFKIIGKVDFLSVIALSGAMLMMANAYKKIGDIKGLDYKKVFMISAVMPLMAVGLVLSGYILRAFPKFTLMQGISMMLVGGALGIATYLVLKSLQKINFKSLIFVPLLPIILPLIALGLVKSSYILKDIKQLSLMQVFAVALVSLALAAATFGIGLVLKGVKNITWKEMLTLPAMIPLIAGGIVAASVIFQAFMPIKNPLQLLVGSLVIGLSILIFTPAIYFLGKLSMTQIVKGTLAVLAVSGAILGVAWIFSLLPTQMKYPEVMWTLGSGFSILAFGLLQIGLGFVAMNPFFWVGIPALLAVAGSMVGVSYILNEGKWNGAYPSLEWSLGVGTSLVAFSAAAIGAAVGGVAGVVATFFTGEDPLIMLAKSMVGVSWLLQSGKWDGGYPSVGWAAGVGLALLGFASVTILAAAGNLVTSILNFFSGDKDPLMTLTQSMVSVSWKLQEGKWNDNYPSMEWAEGVGASLGVFGAITILAATSGLVKSVFAFFSKEKDPLLTLAQSMVGVSLLLQSGKWDGNYPSLPWTLGVSSAMTAFAAITMVSSAASLASSIASFFGDKSGDPLVSLARSMKQVSWILTTGKYEIYPLKNYTDSVSYLMLTMANVTSKGDFDVDDATKFLNSTNFIIPALNSWIQMVSKNDFSKIPVNLLSDQFAYHITSVGTTVTNWKTSQEEALKFLQSMNFIVPAVTSFTSLPVVPLSFLVSMMNMRLALGEISKGISNFSNVDFMFANSIKTIATGLKILGELKPIPDNAVQSFNKFLQFLNKMPEKLFAFDAKVDAIKKLADSLLNLSTSLNTLNGSLTGFLDMSRGLFLISIIDEVKLGNVLKSIEKHNSALKIVNKIPEEQSNLLSVIKSLYETLPEDSTKVKEIGAKADEKIAEKKKQEQFYNDISDIKSLLYQFLDHIDQPSQNGSFHK